MVTGHDPTLGMKIKCNRCGDITPVPLFRYFSGVLFFVFAFFLVFYVLYSSLSVLWPLLYMPFIDYDTGVITFVILIIPAYLGFAWVVGKIIK